MDFPINFFLIVAAPSGFFLCLFVCLLGDCDVARYFKREGGAINYKNPSTESGLFQSLGNFCSFLLKGKVKRGAWHNDTLNAPVTG